MFKKRHRNINSSLLLQTSNRSSDSSSAIANENGTDIDELPKEITAVLSERNLDENLENGENTSVISSVAQSGMDSTPVKLLGVATKDIPSPSYLKCRSTIPPSLNYGKDVYKKVPREISYMNEVLKECGACPLSGNSSYLMSEDQAIFSIKINNLLKKNNDNIKQFMNCLEKEIDKPESLQKMLMHTLTSDKCEIARGPVQESLVRMLLNADCLQADLIELLLKKLADIILNKEESESILVVSSVLRQLRFLNPAKDLNIAQKLLEMIHVSSSNVKREIIFMLPEIVSQDEMEEVSKQLIDMIKYESNLTNVILDAVTNLFLSEDVRSDLRSKILSRLAKCPIEVLPSLVQFILDRCEEEELIQVINGLRENLPFSIEHLQIINREHPDYETYVKLTLEALKFGTMVSKPLADSWMQIISGIDHSSNFRSLDLIILIMLHNSLCTRKSQILSVMRGKIKLLVLTETHVTCMFRILSGVLMEYFSTVLDMASTFLKSTHQVVADFGALLYRQCFVHFHFSMEQKVISEIMLHIGTGSWSTVNNALLTLKYFCDNHKEALSNHTASLMGLLIKIFDLDQAQLRILLDVIADMIFFKPVEVSVGWQDEFQIFVLKLLASLKLDVCKKGILAAVAFGKHAGKLNGHASFDCGQINELLVKTMSLVKTSELKRSFFNDEFATMLLEASLSEWFLSIWSEKIQRMVINNLFVQNIEVECEHFPMSLQYSVNVENDRMVFPVVSFILNTNSGKALNIPIEAIPSSLKMLWCCEKKFNLIQPIFCASVIMPEIVVFDHFHTCDENKKKLIMDCLFLCFNYLTECMNAFCFHNTLDKALLRLKQSISVHKLIQHYIHLMVDYKPPHCQFYSNGRTVAKNKISRPPKKGRKRKLDGSSPAEPCNSETLNNSHVEMDLFALQEVGFDFREYFRQLHVSCLKLLRTDLVFDVDKIFKMAIVTDASFKENCAPYQSQQKVQMSTADALFLLEDCVWKSKHFLGKANNNSNLKSRNLSNAELISPEKFVADTIQVLPDILKKMELWSSYCDDLIRRNEGILDSPGMYVKDARDVKLALSAALNFIAEIISWQGLQKSDNQLLLKDVLAILSKNENFKTQNSCPGFIKNAANKACTYLARFSKSVLILNGGLSIVKAVKACSDHCTAVESSKVLAKLCLEMLHRSWFNVTGTPERGSIYNQRVDFLVKTYFSNVENKLEVVRCTARIVLDEVPQLSNKNSTLTTIKSIHRKNFPLLYRTMCEALVSASAAELVEGNNSQFYLKIWNAIIDTMMTLVNIVKIHSSRINLAALLKRSQSIIQLFFTSGMPLVEAALRVKSVEVLKLLKSLQTVTRFLHSVCCHSKITSDSMVGTYVPTIRARCERLTLEVKGMLISNKIPMECITIAILKNKDLKGNDIISQETVDDDSDEEDSELPAEECDKFRTEDLAF